MIESFERVVTPQNLVRVAILSVLAQCSPSYSKADVPDCHDIGSRPTPAKSVWLSDNTEAEVVCIVDGDTFDVRVPNGQVVRIRIWGVDCPESHENRKCMKNGSAACEAEIKKGKKAKQLTRKLLAGKKITLQGPFSNNGERKLSYVRLKGNDLGRTLIGSCECQEKYSHKRKASYRKTAQRCG